MSFESQEVSVNVMHPNVNVKVSRFLLFLNTSLLCSTSAAGLSFPWSNWQSALISPSAAASAASSAVDDLVSVVDALPVPDALKDGAEQVVSCLLMRDWSDQFLGELCADDVDDYCRPECMRAIPGVTCCAPQSPAQVKVTFQLYDVNGLQVNYSWSEVNSQEAMQRASAYKNLVIVTHG